MKWRAASSVAGMVGAMAAAGLAIAQSSWVTIGVGDVQICRPVFAEVHRLEQEFLVDAIDLSCARGTSGYDSELCGLTRDLLEATREIDDVEWFVSGNDMCEAGSPYPCYGAGYFNTPRTGRDAQRVIAEFREESSKPVRIEAGMDFMSAAPIGDRCLAQAWVAKYDGAAKAGKGTAKLPGPMANSKSQRGVGPTPAAPASAVSQKSLDDCLDGVSSMQACSAMLTGLPPSDPSFGDLALALMVREIGDGRPVEAIRYGDMIADQRPGPDGELVRCTVRVLSKWDLNAGMKACNAAGIEDPGVLELRGQIHLLAGRWDDAWADFDKAYQDGGAVQSLYLRGLASAGRGRMTDAVKDLAQTEEDAPGTTDAFTADGYSLAAVTPGQPLVPAEAFGPASAGASSGATAQPPADPAKPRPPSSPPRVGVVKFAPDAPRGQVPPLPAGRVAECDQALRTAQTESQSWKGTPEEKSLRLGLIQRTLFAGRCAGHVQADAMVADADRTIAISITSAISAYTDPAETSPDAIDCVEPMIPTDPRNTTGTTALRNACAYPVQVAYCNVSPASGSWAEAFTCGNRNVLAMDVIPANGATPAVFGREVQHFACKAPAGPVLTYQAGKGLDGFCK